MVLIGRELKAQPWRKDVAMVTVVIVPNPPEHGEVIAEGQLILQEEPGKKHSHRGVLSTCVTSGAGAGCVVVVVGKAKRYPCQQVMPAYLLVPPELGESDVLVREVLVYPVI